LRTIEMLDEEVAELREEVQRLEARVRSLRSIKFALEDQLDLLQCLVEEYEEDVENRFRDDEEYEDDVKRMNRDDNSFFIMLRLYVPVKEGEMRDSAKPHQRGEMILALDWAHRVEKFFMST